MPTTVNNTLPLNWDSSISYNLGDRVTFGNNIIYKSLKSGNRNHVPASSPEWWDALDIYKKENTIMPHGDYSGDENFWDRDNIYIDDYGYVYANNENTGINVRGKTDVNLHLEDLTPAQIEQIRGQQGPRGEQGPQGIQGPEGPMGQVVLTPEQTAALKGDPGESAYQIWLDQGYIGTEADFLAWLRKIAITIDENLSSSSTNPLENRTIYNKLVEYAAHAVGLLDDLSKRVETLENRLKATYNNEEHDFIFGITDTGEYGYKKTHDTQVIPFDNTTTEGDLQTEQLLSAPMLQNYQFEYHYLNPVIDTIISDDEDFDGTSITREISEENDADVNGTLYTKTLRSKTLDEFADTKIRIYQNGEYIRFSPSGYTRYHVDEETSYLQSQGTENREGIIFGGNLASYGYKVTFKVQPLIEGRTIYYQIGSGNLNAELPTVVNGTNRRRYETGSFNTETYISSFLGEDEKVYLSSDFTWTPPQWEYFPSQYGKVVYNQWNGVYHDIETDFGVNVGEYDKIRIYSWGPTTDSGIFDVSDITTTTMYFSGDELNGLNGIRINPTTGKYEIFTNRGGNYRIECKKSETPSFDKFIITEIYIE